MIPILHSLQSMYIAEFKQWFIKFILILYACKVAILFGILGHIPQSSLSKRYTEKNHKSKCFERNPVN